jgi:predicted GNAT family N-acyltransferase
MDMVNRDQYKSDKSFIPFLVQDQETLNEILYKLRIETWVSMGVFNEGEFKPEDFVDEHDHHAFHWAIKDDSRIVAAARMCVHNSLNDLPDADSYENISSEIKTPIASFNRLVVTPDFQKNGISKMLDKVRIKKAVELECKTIMINVPQNRIKSLLVEGFEVLGKLEVKPSHTWLASFINRFGSIILKKDLQ